MFNRNEYQKQYRKDKLKRVSLEIPKEDYDVIKDHADSRSESVNGFIKRAVKEAIERDNQSNT